MPQDESNFSDSIGYEPTQDSFSNILDPPYKDSRPHGATMVAEVRTSLGAHEAHLGNLFYTRFHPVHPILVPRNHSGGKAYPEYLTLVIQFIGSHYSPTVPSDPIRFATAAALDGQITASVHLVQALLLYAIGLHARNELRDSGAALNKAIDHALELGLNQSESACYRENNDPVFEESIRRTWWELYITDGYLAALQRQASFRCDMVASSALLPCEEYSFMQGIIPIDQPSLTQLRERLFADEEIAFSSFCYKIEAVRIIGRVLAVAGTSEASPDGVQAVDNAIATWRHHLPEQKAEILDDYGEVDLTLFQAHVFIQLASVSPEVQPDARSRHMLIPFFCSCRFSCISLDLSSH